MTATETLAPQKKAARKIAGIMLASLQKFPEAEQVARIIRIEEITVPRI